MVNPLFMYSICYWEVSTFFFWGGVHWENFFFLQREVSRGNLTMGSFQNLCTIFFICFTFSLLTQFYMWMCSRGNSQQCWDVWRIFYEGGWFFMGVIFQFGGTSRKIVNGGGWNSDPAWFEKQSEIKVFFKWNYTDNNGLLYG